QTGGVRLVGGGRGAHEEVNGGTVDIGAVAHYLNRHLSPLSPEREVAVTRRNQCNSGLKSLPVLRFLYRQLRDFIEPFRKRLGKEPGHVLGDHDRHGEILWEMGEDVLEHGRTSRGGPDGDYLPFP